MFLCFFSKKRQKSQGEQGSPCLRPLIEKSLFNGTITQVYVNGLISPPFESTTFVNRPRFAFF